MSFLGDLVSSIGGDKAPPPPPAKQPLRPTAPKSAQQIVSAAAHSGPAAKPIYKGTIGISSSSSSTSQSGALKRKADDTLSEQAVKIPKVDVDKSISDLPSQKSLKINSLDTKQPDSKSSTASPVSQNGSGPQKLPAKAPSKGSYAEMMARAKEAQQNKAPNQVGIIKHQSTEKLKPTRLADRRKEEQERLKSGRNGLSSRSTSARDLRQRSASPAKKSDQPKTFKTAKPPLHGPALLAKSTYKGTLGMSSNRPKEARQSKKSVYDDYLGTDEEDEGVSEDDGDRGDHGDYSDASSDMEGGFDDVEKEEEAALKAAKKDDATELALENRLKREKMEKKQKMAALVAKHKK